MTYNILCFDGGGIKGAFSAALVREIAKEAGPFHEHVDLFAGTSIGAANALALADGKTLDALVDIYSSEGRHIFGDRMVFKGPIGWIVRLLARLPGAREIVNDVDALFLPKWSNHGLRRVLRGRFGDTTLGDLGHKVVVPTCKLDSTRFGSHAAFTEPVLMHNFDDRWGDVSLADAMMRSGAAPTFFESHQGYVDGGVFANNPSTVALAVALDPKLGGQRIDDVRILSLGATLGPEGVKSHHHPLRWGILEWGPRVFTVSATTTVELDSYISGQILEERYVRIDRNMEEGLPMDDWRIVPELLRLAEEMRETEVFARAVEFVRPWVSS